MAKKKSSFLETSKKVLQYLYQALCTVCRVLYRFFELLFGLLKTIFVGTAALLASMALLMIAVTFAAYVMIQLFGIHESETFQNFREEILQEQLDRVRERWDFEMAQDQAREQGYRLAELTDAVCEESIDCETPQDYLIRSSCPYESLCLSGQCGVVCPKSF